MKNFIRSLAVAALLSGLVAGTAFARDPITPGADGIISLTEQNQSLALPNMKGKTILFIACSPEFKTAHLSELRNIADLYKDKLIVIVADPKLEGVGDLVATFVSGPVQYPTALYIGVVLHNLVGPMPDGAITQMTNRGLQGKAGLDTAQ